MFGILHVLGVLLSSTARSVKENVENYKSKQQTSNGYTYIDREGTLRLISNNHPVSIRWNSQTNTNDYVDLKTAKVIKSDIPPVYKQMINKYKEAGRTTMIEHNHRFKMEKCRTQEIYKDIETGAEYVIRKIRGKYYYMDINTGKPVREADIEKKIKTVHRNCEGIHNDEWNKSVDLKLLHDPTFPEVEYEEGY